MLGGSNRLLERLDRAIELLLVNRLQNLTHPRSRRHAERDHVASEQDRFRRTMFDAERPCPLQEPVHRVAVEVAWLATEAIRFRETREQLEIDLGRQPSKGAVADLVAHLEPHPRLQVL